MAQFNFNAAEHNAARSFEVLPKGWYQAKIIESEIANTNGGGQMIKMVAEILAPDFAKGQKAFLRYNIVNSSPDAVRIGLEQLAALSIAIGVPQWTQTESLHERPFQLKLKVVKGGINPKTQEQYDDQNDAAGYDPMSIHRALAVQPMAPNAAAPTTPFNVPAPVAQPVAPMAPPTATFVTPPVAAAPVAPVQAPVAPVQQAAPVQAPAQQAAAPAQPWANAPQPWEQPQAAAPVAPQTAPVQQVAPVAAPVQAPVAPVQAPVAQPEVAPAASAPWQTATVDPQPQAQAAAPAAAAPAEPPHPAQAMTPPWMQGQTA